MIAHPARPRWIPDARVLAGAVAVGLGYAALAKLVAVVTAFGNTTGATFWPGAGLTLAVLLRRPRSEWPFYLGAVAIAELSVDLSEGFGVAVSLGWALANTAEPLAAAWLLSLRGVWAADALRRRELPVFVLSALVAGPVLGALVGAASGVLFAGDPWLPRLTRWYVGDAIGVLVVAPALLALRRPPWRRPSARAAGWFAVLGAAALLTLGPWDRAGDYGLVFLTLPVLSGFAMRYGPRGAAAGVLLVALIVEAVTAEGRGPFAQGGAFEGLVVAQMFVAMNAVTAHAVAVLASELVTHERLEEKLREQAMRDSLTGLANRRLLFDRIEHASRRLARRPQMLALLFIDLDAFKAANDTYGHSAGDAVLVETARRLRAGVRDHDSVARLGGDEFLILAEDLADGEDAIGLACRVVEALDEPIATPAGAIKVSASVGIALTRAPVEDAETYLASADRAMYVAKRAGGGRVTVVEHGPGAVPQLAR